ncbi:MAG: hypothetical protein IJI45_14300, partial [Anaerolineaceae bacterium]|nr:hypothetical protein [Anaerolineaceae bacterium]
MKNILILLLTVLLIISSVSSVMAQETSDTTLPDAEEQTIPAETSEEKNAVPLAQRFPAIRIHDQFSAYVPVMYYRFSPDVLFFEPIDLSYFPHEKWNK